MTQTPSYRDTAIAMDTIVSIEVVTDQPETAVRPAIQRALRWFGEVEQVCSRFDPDSELRRLCTQVGKPVVVGTVLFEAVRFAVVLARETAGLFDPTVGQVLEAHGFDRNYRTGQRTSAQVQQQARVQDQARGGGRVNFRDVLVNPGRRTVLLRRPLLLDLGAVAKGLAIDLAACELAAFDSFCVDAGGDLLARGHNQRGRPWTIGVQDPRAPESLAFLLSVSGQAVGTSGDYERRTPAGDEHHLLDPRTGRSGQSLTSATVVAPTALAADGLATAAFLLGPKRGLRLLEREGVGGVLIAPDGELLLTHELQDAGAQAVRAEAMKAQPRDSQDVAL
jgi:thiamine biosynthesis lipoprotein